MLGSILFPLLLLLSFAMQVLHLALQSGITPGGARRTELIEWQESNQPDPQTPGQAGAARGGDGRRRRRPGRGAGPTCSKPAPRRWPLRRGRGRRRLAAGSWWRQVRRRPGCSASVYSADPGSSGVPDATSARTSSARLLLRLRSPSLRGRREKWAWFLLIPYFCSPPHPMPLCRGDRNNFLLD